MANKTNAGVRVGDWFLWIDCEIIQTKTDDRSYPLVRLRKAITGGDVITSVVGSREMAKALQQAAQNIEDAVTACERADVPDEVQNAPTPTPDGQETE